MKHLFPSTGALLLALVGLTPAARAQSFGTPVVYSTGTNSQPTDVALGDVNGDGLLDLVTTNDGTSSVSVLLGQAGGTFGSRTSYAASYHPYRVALGDMNQDGRLDIVVAGLGSYNVGVLLGQPGGFAAMAGYSPGANSNINSVVLRDVTGDGLLDVVTTYSNIVAVLPGRVGGLSGSFIKYTVSNLDTGVSGPALGDVTGDGLLDVVVANSEQGYNSVTVVAGLVGGGFSGNVSYLTGPGRQEPVQVLLRDMNQDGRLDILALNHWSSMLSVLLGQAGGSFGAPTQYQLKPGGQPASMTTADVNGDGRFDVLSADDNGQSFTVLLGQAGGTFAPAVSFGSLGGNDPYAVALADINGDNRPDVVTANYGSSNVSVLLNTGTYAPLATRAQSAAEVALYPNPAQTGFTVRILAGAGILRGPAELLNALGQVVRRVSLPAAGGWIDTQGLPGGAFLLRLPLDEATLTRRVMVQE